MKKCAKFATWAFFASVALASGQQAENSPWYTTVPAPTFVERPHSSSTPSSHVPGVDQDGFVTQDFYGGKFKSAFKRALSAADQQEMEQMNNFAGTGRQFAEGDDVVTPRQASTAHKNVLASEKASPINLSRYTQNLRHPLGRSDPFAGVNPFGGSNPLGGGANPFGGANPLGGGANPFGGANPLGGGANPLDRFSGLVGGQQYGGNYNQQGSSNFQQTPSGYGETYQQNYGSGPGPTGLNSIIAQLTNSPLYLLSGNGGGGNFFSQTNQYSQQSPFGIFRNGLPSFPANLPLGGQHQKSVPVQAYKQMQHGTTYTTYAPRQADDFGGSSFLPNFGGISSKNLGASSDRGGQRNSGGGFRPIRRPVHHEEAVPATDHATVEDTDYWYAPYARNFGDN